MQTVSVCCTDYYKVEPKRGQIELYTYKLSGVNCYEKVNVHLLGQVRNASETISDQGLSSKVQQARLNRKPRLLKAPPIHQ